MLFMLASFRNVFRMASSSVPFLGDMIYFVLVLDLSAVLELEDRFYLKVERG